MNRRERFRRITTFQEADRVPVDMGSHVASIHRLCYQKLRAYLQDEELQNQDKILDRMVQNVVPDEKLLQRYHVDFRWIAPNWIDVTDVSQDIYRDMWGIEWQYMLDAYSVYSSPLSHARTTADIDNHPWPDPEHPDLVRGVGEHAKRLYENTDYVLVADSIKGGLLTKALQIRGYQQMFADLVNNVPLAEALLDKLLDLYKLFWTQFLRRVGPYVQMVYFTDDIGGQQSMMISPDTFRQLIKPRLANLIDHIKSQADVKFMYHTDGTVTPVIEDIIEMGVDVLNPIQTSALGMNTAVLKELYHGRLCFHGAIDVQQMLPFSTPEEVRYDVAKRLYDLARGGGYILAPCHNIGSDVPPANVEALYAAAHELGGYPIAVDHILREEDRRPPTAVDIARQAAPQKRVRRPRPRRRE
ncbi:MAG: uroporphyrinogen decarboxylase family protein [Ardenticatenaceae bacterium]|nr:uroporphyrinogen decarboxylase family protein [Ardenticatenaceae bacterium]